MGGQEAHKKVFKTLIIRKMQIETTVRYYLTPVRWPSLKSLLITNAGEDVEKRGTLLTLLVGYKLVHLLWKTVWRFLNNLKIELPYDPAFSLLGIYPQSNDAYDVFFVLALSPVWERGD